MYNEDITFFDTIRVWVYDGIFILNSIRVYTHARVSRMVLNQIITRVYKDSLFLTYPPNINIWLELQACYAWVSSLTPLLMFIIDTMHSPIYQTNTGLFPGRSKCATAPQSIGFLTLNDLNVQKMWLKFKWSIFLKNKYYLAISFTDVVVEIVYHLQSSTIVFYVWLSSMPHEVLKSEIVL